MKESLSKERIKVIAVVGATASGKTEYSINLAQNIGGEIISADSRLVYKGFDIGTAKPTPKEMCGIPHHMIDIVEPEFEYSAALFKDEARKKIYEIHQRGKIPIVAGGTGLYIDILLKNFVLPKIEPNKELRYELSSIPSQDLHQKLQKLDAEAAQKISSSDKKKIIRALEIIEKTGHRISEVCSKGAPEFDVKWIGRNFDRKILYERINKRVDSMIEKGLVEETKNLIEKHGKISNIVDTIGYREISRYLEGEITLQEAIDLLKQNTRHYAKRQLTWFRRNPEIEWNIYPEILKK